MGTKPMHLYVMGGWNRSKIGISSNPHQRSLHLRARLLRQWELPNAREIEAMIKGVLEHLTVSGKEWFAIEGDDLIEAAEYVIAVFDHSLPRPRFPKVLKGDYMPAERKITDKVKDQIRALVMKGWTVKAIAKKYKVHPQTIYSNFKGGKRGILIAAARKRTKR